MSFINKAVGLATGGLIDDITGEKAASKAAAAGSRISKENLDAIVKGMDSAWEDVQGWLTPYLDEGQTALQAYKSAIGAAPDAPVFDNFNFSFDDYQNSDAYKFLMDQGTQAVMRSSAAGRRLNSGQNMIDLMQFGQGLASQEYGNEFARQLSAADFNRGSQAMTYDAARGRWGDVMDANAYLIGNDMTTRNNLASMRFGRENVVANARSGNAAAQTAAAMLPYQAKTSFTNNLLSAAGMAVGGMMGNPAAAAGAASPQIPYYLQRP